MFEKGTDSVQTDYFPSRSQRPTYQKPIFFQGKVIFTKKEKEYLEEITHLTSKLRAPLDDRQMLRYKKDLEKISTKIAIPQSDISTDEIKNSVPEMEKNLPNLAATQVLDLAGYLNELKSLIARRELAWANSRDIDYAQKTEIGRLRNEVSHLRVVANKKDGDLKEKEKIIADKDMEIERLQKVVQKLKISKYKQMLIYHECGYEIESRLK